MKTETLNLILNAIVAIIVPVAGLWIKAKFKKLDDNHVETVRTLVNTGEKLVDYHKEVNGMKDELVALTRVEGLKEGAEINQAETDAKRQKDK